MVARFNRAQFDAQVRAAQRKVQAEVDRVNRENQRKVDDYNRRARQHNQQEQRRVQGQIDAYNREVSRVNAHNQGVSQQNRRAIDQNRRSVAEINRQLRSSATTGPVYTPAERSLADRVQEQVVNHSDKERDAFLSYARIDGAEVGTELRDELEALGVDVWFDEIAITPGRSQSLQMDKGLRSSRSGIALLTPAYLTGRFWTERELGALLHKAMLIPVLHNVTFEEVAEYSGILPDLAGFETKRDSIAVIAEKIAAAVLPEGADSDDSGS